MRETLPLQSPQEVLHLEAARAHGPACGVAREVADEQVFFGAFLLSWAGRFLCHRRQDRLPMRRQIAVRFGVCCLLRSSIGRRGDFRDVDRYFAQRRDCDSACVAQSRRWVVLRTGYRLCRPFVLRQGAPRERSVFLLHPLRGSRSSFAPETIVFFAVLPHAYRTVLRPGRVQLAVG